MQVVVASQMENDGDYTSTFNSRSSRDGHDRPPATPSLASPPTSFASSSSGLSSRRRSSAAALMRPAGPPPNLPIPSVPPSVTTSHDNLHADHDTQAYSTITNGNASQMRRSNPTTNNTLTGAAISFPQASSSSAHSMNPSLDDLSDPPPASILYPTSSRISVPEEHHEAAQDRHLAVPGTEPRREHREHRVPSSRRALTRALELAREAVRLDSMNNQPEAAVEAYGRSVALLSEVMERVRRGEDSTESHRRRRRRSVAAQEEEIRRLQNIHDTYADRMNILSIIYSIPTIPYSGIGLYNSLEASVISPSATSPANSTSPSSDSSPQIPPQNTHYLNGLPNQGQADPSGSHELDGAEAMSPTVFTLDELGYSGSVISGLPSTSTYQHPYAQYDPSYSSPTSANSTPSVSRTQTVRRPRASSALPPAQPPPSNSLPPAPNELHRENTLESISQSPQRHVDARLRSRGESAPGHRRAGSLGLNPVKEEFDDNDAKYSETESVGSVEPVWAIAEQPASIANKRDSHPLPPLPSPTLSSPGIPVQFQPTIDQDPLVPRHSSTNFPSRSRGASQLLARTDSSSQAIINQTTYQGTIYQRRTTKSSAPPTPRSASPIDSTTSVNSSSGPKATSSSLPGASPLGVASTRTRSSSQPGRRPSLIGGNVAPVENRPPLPNGTAIRKSSIPSKLNPNAQSAPLTVQTDLPPASTSLSLLPPAALNANLPITPVSPLPPAPPSEPLLKPYHLMHLLRNTMTSASGGYITRRLHVPLEVWSQGGAKLTNLVEKVRAVAILCSALEDLQTSSSEHFGAGNICSGLALGIGSIGKKEADAWVAKLDEFSSICDDIVNNFGKKLGVGEGFVLKKSTWGDKLTRSFDKITNGKNLDSPTAYTRGLDRLFDRVQLLDEHTRALVAKPTAPAYAAFPPDSRALIEQKLKRTSEFFGTVVLTFVIRDLSQLLDKYAKKCEKWLEE